MLLGVGITQWCEVPGSAQAWQVKTSAQLLDSSVTAKWRLRDTTGFMSSVHIDVPGH